MDKGMIVILALKLGIIRMEKLPPRARWQDRIVLSIHNSMAAWIQMEDLALPSKTQTTD